MFIKKKGESWAAKSLHTVSCILYELVTKDVMFIYLCVCICSLFLLCICTVYVYIETQICTLHTLTHISKAIEQYISLELKNELRQKFLLA